MEKSIIVEKEISSRLTNYGEVGCGCELDVFNHERTTVVINYVTRYLSQQLT